MLQLGHVNLSSREEVLRQRAAGVVHDFNNILDVIIGYCELMAVTVPENPELHQKIREIRKAADRGVAMTRSLLAVYRDEAVDSVILDVNRVLHESLDFFQRLVGPHIRINVVFGANLFPVRTNATQVHRVIMNLLTNARRAMPDGGTLVIESAATEIGENNLEHQAGIRTGRYTTIAVIDSGSGMDSQTMARIFDPFYTTNEKGSGTGLGLSIVQEIAEQSDGYASVESWLGSGTTFKLFLPAAS